MKQITAILVYLFITHSVFGQENQAEKIYKNLKFTTGLPAEMLNSSDRSNKASYSFTRFPVLDLKEELVFVVFTNQQKLKSYFLFKAGEVEKIIQIEFTLVDKNEIFKKVYENDDEYRYFLELKKSGEEFYYTVEKKAKILVEKSGQIKSYDDTPENRVVFEIGAANIREESSSFYSYPSREVAVKPNYKLGYYSVGISYSYRIFLGRNTKLEMRGGLYYSNYICPVIPIGLDFGVFIRNKIIENIFCGLGIKANVSVQWEDDGNSHNTKQGDAFTYPVVFLGYEVSKDFSILFSAFPSVNSDVIYDNTGRNLQPDISPYLLRTREVKKILWGVKLGIDFIL